MNIETKIALDKFQPRHYQLPIIDAIENKGYKRVIFIAPRRSGKDIVAWNIIIRQAIKKVGVYWYILPTYSQAKKIIWDSRLNSSVKDGSSALSFLDFIPAELIKRTNSQEMKIVLFNDSIIQLVGSENVDSLVGTNAIGMVFSEYALQSPLAYQLLRPILLGNDGWALFVSTPRGKNSLYELYQIAQHSPDWFAYKLTLDDTKHIPMSEIEKERAEGLMSDDLIQQEYFCSFEMGVEGSYYAKYIDRMRLKGQIGIVPWEPSFSVNVAFDLGVRDSTCLIFFQNIGATVRIIDCYEKQKEGLEHYVNVIRSKPYTYNKFIFPHDIAVQELGSGITRVEKLKQLGIKATIAPNIGIMDGIEAVRSAFAKIWIDEKNCKDLIKALENYRQEYDPKKRIYSSQPLHNWSSHYADSLRYLCVALPKTRDYGDSAADLEKRYTETVYGNQLPRMFQDGQYERM